MGYRSVEKKNLCTLGTRLRGMRLRAGLSQKQVADCLKYSTTQYISNWERGRSYPPFGYLLTIEDLYGVPRGAVVDLVFQKRVEALMGEKMDLLSSCERNRAFSG